jgi:hypothetical protein
MVTKILKRSNAVFFSLTSLLSHLKKGMSEILQLAGRILLNALKLSANLDTSLRRFVEIRPTQLIPLCHKTRKLDFVQSIYGFRRILRMKNVYVSHLCDGDADFSEV